MGSVDPDRLWRRIEALAGITDPGRPHTRRSFTPLFLKGRDWLRAEMEGIGLSVTLDGAANLVGARPGTTPGLPPIVVGSHSDTVPEGGRFDGIAGVVAGLEVAAALADNGVALRHPLWVVDFLAEEPSKYGVSCVGSRIWAGTLTDSMMRAPGPGGETLAEAVVRMGGRADALPGPMLRPGDIAASVELHIEQARLLESRKLAVGVVTGIAGITRRRITVRGRADHAGATPMDLRQDALVAASRLISWIDRRGKELAAETDGFVATVGYLVLDPNAANVVPGRVEMIVEYRSLSDDLRRDFGEDLATAVRNVEAETGLEIANDHLTEAAPAAASPVVMDAVRTACDDAGLAHVDMPSGAGHDSMHLAKIAPMGMIFIPCRDGRSHCPEEWVEPEWLADGTEALYRAVVKLDAAL